MSAYPSIAVKRPPSQDVRYVPQPDLGLTSSGIDGAIDLAQLRISPDGVGDVIISID